MRNCIHIESSKSKKRHLYIDEENAARIFDYIRQDERHIKKFRFIRDLILGDHKNKQLYSSEEINPHTKGVTAMKFFPGQENDRIYCKEYQTPFGHVVIIAIELFTGKKQTVLKHKEKAIIEKISRYEYNIPEFRGNQ